MLAITPQMIARIDKVFESADRTALHMPPIPYRFSGGHNIEWADSLDYAYGIGAPGAGRDCSAAAEMALRAGGLAWDPRPPLPMGTATLISWGKQGAGILLTLAVVNTRAMQHCALRFNLGSAHQYGLKWSQNALALKANGWYQAPHTGEDVGWHDLGPTGPYQLRHWEGT